jgi:dolichyl-phosphate beta-glucosyltransferase
MGHNTATLSLVVPIHHCEGDLDRTLGELDRFLSTAPVPAELVLVDDHGTDPRAGEQLRGFATRRHVRLLSNDRNRGKGFSVARGMMAAEGAIRVFTDADLAYPLDEVWKIAAAIEAGADIAIACRVLPTSEYLMSAAFLRYIYTRHLVSRAFNALVRMTLIPGVLDTQAGLKGYTADAAQAVFPRVRIDGFGFDLECLFLARQLGLAVEQVPVRFRYADEPTTVRFMRDARTMAADLARIRWRSLTGEYALPARTAPKAPRVPSAHAVTPRRASTPRAPAQPPARKPGVSAS